MNSRFFNRLTQTQPIEVKIPGYRDLPGFQAGGEITPLPLEASVTFLRATAPRIAKSLDSYLESLAEALERQPIAMFLAGRFLNERWFWSYQRYQKALAQSARSLQAGDSDAPNVELESNARLPVAAALLSYKLLEGNGREESLARAVFLAAGYCAPGQPIPKLLLRFATGQNLETGRFIFQFALERLYNLGLLEWTEHGPIIHAVIATAARRLDGSEKKTLRSLIDAGLEICAQQRSSASPERGFTPSALHLEITARHAEAQDKALASQMWQALGQAFWAIPEMQRALYCFEQQLQVDEALHGLLHAQVAADCSLIGRVQHDAGDFRAARSSFLRAILVKEKVFGPDHPSIAEDSVRLGRLLHQTKDLQGARVMFERALAILEKSFDYGPRHPLVGSVLHQLGLVLYDMGLWKEATKIFKRAMDVHQWIYGPFHASVLEDHILLGKTHRAGGNLEDAKANFEQAAEIEGKILGRPGYRSPATLNHLGLVLQELGRLDEAQKCFERAMVVDEEVLGLEHPDVARDVHNLGCVMRDLGDLPAARMYFHRALAINELAYGPDYPDLALNANNLGRVLYAMKDFAAARECFERVLAIDEKIYGPDHPEIATDAANLGTVINALGDVKTAQIYFNRAWDILDRALPPDQIRVINAQKLLDTLKPRSENE